MNLQEAKIFGSVLKSAVNIAASVYPIVATLAPVINKIIDDTLVNLEKGLADGTILQDSGGGFVSSANSRYDPKTGEFLPNPILGKL